MSVCNQCIRGSHNEIANFGRQRRPPRAGTITMSDLSCPFRSIELLPVAHAFSIGQPSLTIATHVRPLALQYTERSSQHEPGIAGHVVAMAPIVRDDCIVTSCLPLTCHAQV